MAKFFPNSENNVSQNIFEQNSFRFDGIYLEVLKLIHKEIEGLSQHSCNIWEVARGCKGVAANTYQDWFLKFRYSEKATKICFDIKVHIFWEGHKILRNLHLTFVLCSTSQK